jgi:hypothetical protein
MVPAPQMQMVIIIDLFIVNNILNSENSFSMNRK